MTGTLLERLAQLGPAQRELVEQRLGRPPVVATPLTANGRSGPSPASPTQRSMWFVHHLDPTSPVLNNGSAVRIRGPLDVDALSAALAELVGRHEILRTTYRFVGGELVQSVQPAPGTVLELVKVRTPDSERLHRELEAEASRPFDLERDLMYRAVLYELADAHHILLRSSHHIAFDRWSLALANREIGESYAARLAGRTPELPHLPIQYQDFARWQVEKLSSDPADTRLRFFTAHVAGVPAYLELPIDRPRTTALGAAATLSERMSDELTQRVRRVAREMGATPFMVLLAAFGVLIGRFTRADQFLVGVPVALRTEPKVADLVGPFINTVAMRLDLRGDPTFRDLVERVRRASLGVIAHQDLPFDELVRTVAPDRVATRTPLFQVMFDYLNTPHAELTLGDDLALEPIHLEAASSPHDLTLYVEDRPSSIRTRWEHRSDLFDRGTIGALAGAYDFLVERLGADPASRVADIGLLDPSHEVSVRSMGAGPTVDVRSTHVLAELEAQRASTPRAVAVEAAGAEHSFDELAAMARQVAVMLRDRGLGPADPVGVLLDRTPRLIAGLLGVMMAGGTAILLDPDQPPRRLSQMIRTVEPVLLLTDDHRDVAPPGVPVVTLGPLLGVAPGSAESFAPLVPIDSGQPAYAVFTSGSTGRPKCVVVGHGSLANFVGEARSAYELGPSDRVLQFASPGFDTFLEEIFPILSVGGTVVMRPTALFPSFEAFERFVEDQRISVLDLPTAWWHAWVDDLAGSDRSLSACLRVVIVGGEAARSDVWTAWTKIAGDVRWVNSYGPSEATVVVSTYEPPPGYRPSTPTMPIGRPIRNTSLVVVDADGHVVPPRVRGELVIEGAAVALGYLGEDQGSGFEDHGTSGRRYRTGDLARLLPDGNLLFEGRIDRQIKVRGTRVEPAEVEAALRAHPQIREAVVVPDPTSGLVGHVVLREVGLEPSQIRAHLSESLPEPIIPGTWRFHESLPVTPGGKFDRRQLERLDDRPPTGHVDRVMPHTEMEITLAEIWAAVLDVQDISVTDSFFDLGGHSLLGVKLMSQISSQLGTQLPLRMIFDAPTIESMARALTDATKRRSLEVTRDSLIPVRVVGDATPFFCVHGAGGGVFFVGDLANLLDGNRPIYGLQARGFETQPGPYRTIEELAARYLEEIRPVQPQGAYLLGGLSLGGKIAFEMAQQLVRAGEEVALVAMIDTQERPDIRSADPGRHRARLRSMGPIEGLTYVARGTGKRISRSAKRGLIKYHLRRGRPLPDTLGLRNLYFYPMHAEANRAYTPEAYPGRVAVIASEGKTRLHEETWGRLAEGGFSVDEIATPHAGLLKPPHDVEVAGHLQRLLDEADPEV